MEDRHLPSQQEQNLRGQGVDHQGPVLPSRPSNIEHPVALGSFWSWVTLLGLSDGMDGSYILRGLFVLLTTLVTSPLRIWEWAKYGKAIRRTKIHPSPIFILGHWRSGTTHLHHLLCQDQRLGFISTFQAMAPGFFLMGRGRMQRMVAALAASRYPTRLIDNVPLQFDAPQEDEFALGSLSPYSFLHVFSFPRQADSFFEKYVLFDGISRTQKRRWTRTYLRLLQKVTIANGGRRLVLKNCAHAGRIRVLLELFPDARFIHIHRNPYDVFASTLHMHKTVLLRSQLQNADPAQTRENVLRFYEKVMTRLLADKELIPVGNWVDVRFEDLEQGPMDELKRIYETLQLPGFEEASPVFREYLRSVADYRKNTYDIDADLLDAVNQRWGFAFDAWAYDRRCPNSDNASSKG